MKFESIVSLALGCVALIGCGDRASSVATISNVPAAATYECTPCSGRGAPPMFDGGWIFSVVGSDGRSGGSYNFQSYGECNAYRNSLYACTGKPPMSTDH